MICGTCFAKLEEREKVAWTLRVPMAGRLTINTCVPCFQAQGTNSEVVKEEVRSYDGPKGDLAVSNSRALVRERSRRHNMKPKEIAWCLRSYSRLFAH